MINSRSESKDLSVYDFSAEELEVESFACMYAAKFKAKSEFKENKVADPKSESMQNYNSTPEASVIDSPGKKVAIEKSTFNENMASSTSYAKCPGMCLDEFDTDMLITEDPIAKPVSDLQFDGIPVDVISKDEEGSTPSPVSLSASASDHEDTCLAAHVEKETEGLSVIVSPDYIIYENILYGEAQLVFSSDSILVKCSDASGDVFVERAVADILYIESQWSESVGATLIKFRFGVNTVNKDEVHETHDFMELLFSVTDMSWLDKEQKIKCLAERYKVVWNIPRYGNYELEEACVTGKNFFPRYYFTEIPYSFEEVVYPKDDPDAVSIRRRDIEFLEPNSFVNDTIIDFYIKYLKTKIPVNERHMYHFFNSFFFRKLADPDKDQGSASEGRAAFLRVRKWTRKINIFEKDYIFIPVNFSLHWSLLVICHPGEVGILTDGEVKDSPKVPCILHMDSFKGNHSGLKDIIQSYLLEEWKERHPEATEDYTSKFLNLRFVPLELPQQENTFDCGLFLLHYVELFLQGAQLDFNPLKISKSSSFLTPDWFIPSEASFKRSLIRRLIYDLLDDNLQNVASESRLNDTNMEKTPISEHYNEHCTQSKTAHNTSVSSIMVNGIELDIGTSSDLCIKHDKKEELSMHEVSKPGTNSTCIFKEDASIQTLACSTEVVETDKLEQLTSIQDDDICEELDEMSKSFNFLTTNNAKDTEEVDIQPNSRQEKEEADSVISPKACDSPTTPNEDNEKQDTPISSSGENQDNDSLENNEEDQVLNTTDSGNEKCDHMQVPTAAGSGDDVKHEKTEVQSLIDGIELENCNHTLPDENIGGINKNDDDDDNDKQNVCEDFQEIEVITEGKGDNVTDGRQTDTHNVISEVPTDIIDVEENPASDSPRKKRSGSNTKNAVNSRKKRKVSLPEGPRRLTRSCFKKRNARK